VIALDHLVVMARSLDEGARWLEQELGVPPDPGGAHAGFGTHNALLRLGADVYLELLAPDPAQPTPPRPRLFGLDEPETRRLLEGGPRLLHWVARTDDLPGALAHLAADAGVAAPDLGLPTPMRRGDLAWSLAIRADGARPSGGLPSLIDWGGAPHPCSRLPDRGLSLGALEAALSPAAAAALAGLLSDARVRIAPSERARLAARLGSPRGEMALG
jgi:hypothetical protein